jgi:AcrR family transcriptional regulator
LLDVARKLLLTDEANDLTVDRVTNAAGVAKGTFYLYFESKDHLLAKLWANYVDGFLESTQTVVAEAASTGWIRAVDTLIDRMVRYDVENAVLHRAVLGKASGDALRLLHRADTKVIELIETAIESAVAEGAFSVTYTKTTASLLYYAVDGILNSAYLTGTEVNAEEVIPAATEMAHRTLGIDLSAPK